MCVDQRFVAELSWYEVKTVAEMGWSGIKNGDLLTLAEEDFDVLITVDRNIPFQQNLSKYNIAVLILHAPSNRLIDLKLLKPKIISILPVLAKGEAEVVKL